MYEDEHGRTLSEEQVRERMKTRAWKAFIFADKRGECESALTAARTFALLEKA